MNFTQVVKMEDTVLSETEKRNARSCTGKPCLNLIRHKENSCSKVKALAVLITFNAMLCEIWACFSPAQ